MPSDRSTTDPVAPVAVVVLTYQGRALTLDCLHSLYEAEPAGAIAVFVVDNASSDGTAEAVRAEYPQAVLLRSETNRGFTGGNNLGISAALERGHPYILVLNNDTLVEQGAVSCLAEALERAPQAGAASPLITFADDPGMIWFAGASYDARSGHPGTMLDYRKPLASAPRRDGPTARFTGCAVMFRAETLREVGLFDPDLFFLYEDVDLSLRIRSSGRTVQYVPDAVIRHRVALSEVGRSSRSAPGSQGGEHSPASFYYGVRNQLEVGRRHAPLRGGREALRTVHTLASFGYRLRRAPARAQSAKAIWHGYRDFRERRFGPRAAAS